MRTKPAKVLLVIAQIMPLIVGAELVFGGSIWTAPLASIAIFWSGTLKCRHCCLPVWDKSVMGTRLPVKSAVLDVCPRCGRQMLAP